MNISSISNVNSIAQKSTSNATQSGTFENVLNDAMTMANQTDQENSQDTINLLTGDVNDLHTSMINMEKADLALQFTVQVRNKILDAYTEIMRMQV